MTELIFGEPLKEPDVLCREIPMDAAVIDKAAQKIEHWCADRGWDPEIITKVELIFEEKMMNLYDHGYDIRERSGEQALFYLRKNEEYVEVTIWDWGTQEPSLPVAAGNPDVEMELKNRDFSGRGRGRLMMRKICSSIERNRFETLNETRYRIALDDRTK